MNTRQIANVFPLQFSGNTVGLVLYRVVNAITEATETGEVTLDQLAYEVRRQEHRSAHRRGANITVDSGNNLDGCSYQPYGQRLRLELLERTRVSFEDGQWQEFLRTFLSIDLTQELVYRRRTV